MANLRKNTIGSMSLTLISCSTIIGAGWFFGSYEALKLAGPSSIISWALGGLVILLIAFTAIEVCTLFPKAGGLVHFLNITHGRFAGFICAFACWFVISSISSFEAVIATKYLSILSPKFNIFFNFNTSSLTHTGSIAAIIFLIVFLLLNYFSVNFFIKFNSLIAFFKIFVPAITALSFIVCGFLSPTSNPIKSSFTPYGWSACFSAITTCGIVFAFNGFQSILSFAAEVKDHEENLPVALISSIIFCIILYIFLQIAFIIALQPETLKITQWKSINLNTPFTQLAMALNLNFVLIMLYIDTIVSPCGTGIIHFSASSRMICGMNEYSQMPKKLAAIDSKYRIPRRALLFNFIFCTILILIFKRWQIILTTISVGCVITFITGPVAILTLRKKAPDLKRPFRLPAANIIAPIAFVLSTFFLYWAGWWPIVTISAIILGALIIFIIFGYEKENNEFFSDMKACLWLITYFVLISILSFIGSSNFGGLGYLSSGIDHIIIVIISLIIFYWAIASGSYQPKSNQ